MRPFFLQAGSILCTASGCTVETHSLNNAKHVASLEQHLNEVETAVDSNFTKRILNLYGFMVCRCSTSCCRQDQQRSTIGQVGDDTLTDNTEASLPPYTVGTLVFIMNRVKASLPQDWCDADLGGFYDQIKGLPLLAASQEHNSSIVEQAGRDEGLGWLGVSICLWALLYGNLPMQVKALLVCLQSACAPGSLKDTYTKHLNAM